MYWRMLTADSAAARDIVMSEKPVISTETDRMDKGMLDQLLLHTGTLGSIYHKNPNVSCLHNCYACLLLAHDPVRASSERLVLVTCPVSPTELMRYLCADCSRLSCT